jgi:RhtB (resistance to homoserine/threonine) family protein
MEHLLGLGLAYLAFIGAVMAPGPDLLITMRNALGYSARAGIFTALGIGCALSIHITYCIAGIGLVISQSILLFNLIKWAGAAYLIYVGIHALRSKGTDLSKKEVTKDLSATTKSDRTAFMNGFITNLFNPKATLLFLALFSQMIDPSIPLQYIVIFGAICMITSFLWFSGVSIIMGIQKIRRAYATASQNIDRVFGAIFIALGVKIALTR